MEKRIFLSLLIVICLLITGCGSKKEKEPTPDDLEPEYIEVKSVKIPDVSNLSVDEAIKKLNKSGFVNIAVETIKESSKTIEEGNVIKTTPAAGRSVKTNTAITLYESIGNLEYTVEDYTGKNYIEIETLLKNNYGINVIIEKKDSSGNYGAQEIIDQSVKKGTTLNKGDSIILYISNQNLQYPDMISEGWEEKDVQQFCEKYELNCTIEKVEDSNYDSGTIIYQSRSPKTPITAKETLRIKIAK